MAACCFNYLCLRSGNEGPIIRRLFSWATMKPRKSRSLLLVGVGSMLTSMVVSGFLLGYAMDVWIETKPIFMVLFGGLGFIGGFIKVYKLLIHPDLN